VPRDPEDLLADWERRINEQTTLTAELGQRIEQNSASVRSTGGEAVVTVDSSGGLAGLRLTDAAMHLPASELALIILDTNRRAQAKLARQMVDLVASVYGTDSDSASFIGGAYTERFPEQPDDEERDRR
jgi:hypothetical protein